MWAHTAHTSAHIGIGEKWDRRRDVTEYPRVPGSEVLLAKYHLVERLSGVDAGEAHLAKLVGAEGFEKPVLLWCFRGRPSRDEQLVRAVMQEARDAASLSHANIAQVLNLELADDLCVLVTEYVSGRTLAEILGALGELPWPLVAGVAAEVSAALAYAHTRRNDEGELLRLVHRRLSSSRITLGEGGDVKVTGFGASLAWMAPETYRAPEESRGEPVDGRADVFALGKIIQECVLETRAPMALRALVQSALHPYPEQRPTAATMEEELRRILHSSGQVTTSNDVAALTARAAQTRPGSHEASFSDYLLRTADELEKRGAVFEAILRLELALDSMSLSSSRHSTTVLDAYERLGRLSVRAQAGERSIGRITRALDLADSLGRDEYAALFCALRGELLAQAERDDESRDWLERAAAWSHR